MEWRRVGRASLWLAVHDRNGRIEGFQVGPIGADDSGVMAAGDEHDRCVDDVGGSRSAAQDSSGPSANVGQGLHDHIASVEQSGQSRLASAPSPHLADDTGRHEYCSMLQPCNFDDRGCVTITPLNRDQGPGVEDQTQRCSARASRCRARESSSSVRGPPVSSNSSARTWARSSPSTRARPASLSQALSDFALPSATSRRARSATAGSRLTVTLITVILLPYQALAPYGQSSRKGRRPEIDNSLSAGVRWQSGGDIWGRQF